MLGKAVKARRTRQGWTQTQVAEAGGPSHATLVKLENGNLPKLTPAVLAKLDQGLNWAPGSAVAIMSGGEPTPLETSRRAVVAGPQHIPLPVEELTNLIKLSKVVDTGLAEADADARAVRLARRAMRDFLSRIVGRYATELLERNGGPDTQLPAIIELSFGELLDQPLDPDNALEREEQLYRRWLSGRLTATDVETEDRFRARWQHSQDVWGSAGEGPARRRA
ncbi:helix-turn-helix transcriptional regulator [Skermania piniformis]